MVGGDDYATKPFNLATQGQRQPGSAFKPFVLAEALEDGISPDSVWSSHKLTFNLGKEHVVVENYNDAYAGITTLAHATTFSDNSVYVQVARRIGSKKVARLAREMGIRTPVSRNLSIALGGLHQGVTPIDMAHAYLTFANGGKFVYGTMSPGELRGIRRPGPGRHRADQPRQGRAGHAARPARRPSTSARDEADPRREGRRRPSPRCCSRSSRTAPARAPRCRHVRGRQDRHDRELRRRLVRRLDGPLHGGDLGRLPGQAAADEDRVRRPAGRRRHVPGRDLPRLHPERVRRLSQEGEGEEEGRGRRRRHAVAGTPGQPRADHAHPRRAPGAHGRRRRRRGRRRRRRRHRRRPSRATEQPRRRAAAAPSRRRAPTGGRAAAADRRDRRQPRPASRDAPEGPQAAAGQRPRDRARARPRRSARAAPAPW